MLIRRGAGGGFSHQEHSAAAAAFLRFSTLFPSQFAVATHFFSDNSCAPSHTRKTQFPKQETGDFELVRVLFSCFI